MAFNLTLPFLLLCLNHSVNEIQMDCFRQVEKEQRIYEMFRSSKEEMIPYSNWCSYVSCRWNKCNVKNDFPVCKTRK